jgi:hypothetical protein
MQHTEGDHSIYLLGIGWEIVEKPIRTTTTTKIWIRRHTRVIDNFFDTGDKFKRRTYQLREDAKNTVTKKNDTYPD